MRAQQAPLRVRYHGWRARWRTATGHHIPAGGVTGQDQPAANLGTARPPAVTGRIGRTTAEFIRQRSKRFCDTDCAGSTAPAVTGGKDRQSRLLGAEGLHRFHRQINAEVRNAGT